ncbi:MAG: co-chaperone GroES [Syntrophorhabdaceae bacterium]
MGLEPLEDVIIVEPYYNKEKTTINGIIIPSTAENNKIERGRVVAVGEGRHDDRGFFVKPTVKVGQDIFYYLSSAFEMKYEGKTYHFIDESVSVAII